MQALQSRGMMVIACGFVGWGLVAFAQQAPAGRGRGAAAEAAARPPLLFKEDWKLPPHQGNATDENMRLTPAVVASGSVVANDRLALTLYGDGASFIRAAEHEGRLDLWTGLATTPTAVTLKDKRNYVDLTGLARLRWIVRTTSIQTMYPIVKLADGTLIAGNRGITTDGEFMQVEVEFRPLPEVGGMRWFKVDPMKVVATTEAKTPDFSKVDELGMAFLAPNGGHGVAASANLSTVELYAKAVPR